MLDQAAPAGVMVIARGRRASETIASRIPSSVIAVSESGLRSAADIARLRALGYHAFLIGERFMTVPDPGAALAELLASSAA